MADCDLAELSKKEKELFLQIDPNISKFCSLKSHTQYIFVYNFFFLSADSKFLKWCCSQIPHSSV